MSADHQQRCLASHPDRRVSLKVACCGLSTIREVLDAIVAVAWLGTFAAGADSSAGERAPLPGRQVKVAAIAIGFGGDHDKKLRLAHRTPGDGGPAGR